MSVNDQVASCRNPAHTDVIGVSVGTIIGAVGESEPQWPPIVTSRGGRGRGTTLLRAAEGAVMGVVSDRQDRVTSFCSGNPRVLIVTEGRITNLAALRRDVQCEAPEDVLPGLYARWGCTFVNRLHGSFSLVLWDANQQILLLTRDRSACRPLYYADDGHQITFASEIDVLLTMLPTKPRLEPSSLLTYFSFLFAAAPATFFKGIAQVAPGEIVVWHGRRKSVRTFEQSRDVLSAKSLDDAVAGVRGHLTDAVETLAPSARAVWLLSSGVDSSTIIALAARRWSDIRTVTMGFPDEASFDERADARKIARFIGVHNDEIIVDHTCLDLLPEVTRSLGAPAGNPAALLAAAMFRQLTPSYDTVICGDGGNEVFGGVPKYFQLLSRLAGASSPRATTLLHAVARRVWHRLQAIGGATLFHRAAQVYFRTIGESAIQATRSMSAEAFHAALISYASLEAIWQRESIDDVLAPALRPLHQDDAAVRVFREALPTPGDHDLLQQLIPLRLRTVIAQNVLPYVERNAAAHGLEARFPYLYDPLREYVERLPISLNFARGYRFLMQRAFGHLVPRSAYQHVRGFNTPLTLWLRRKQWREAVLDLLSSAAVAKRGWLDAKAVQRLVQDFYRGQLSFAAKGGEHLQSLPLAVWSLAAVEAFCREYE